MRTTKSSQVNPYDFYEVWLGPEKKIAVVATNMTKVGEFAKKYYATPKISKMDDAKRKKWRGPVIYLD